MNKYYTFILQPKKKKVFLFYIYNFHFENLIYKWIKKLENLQQSGPIFFCNVLVEIRVVFLQDCPFILSLFKHMDERVFLNKKMRIPNRGSPLKSSIYHFLIFVSFSSHIFFHTLTLLLKSYLREKEKKIIINLFTSIILDQSHHMCFTRAMRLSYFSGPVLQQKKKNCVFILYI